VSISAEQAWRILQSAELVCPASAVAAAVERIAREVSTNLEQRHPLVLGVMRGSVVFAGRLLPMLRFPLEFDYLDVTRYGDETHGGAISWKVSPGTRVRGRTVLVIDDILDEGQTLYAIRERLLAAGASEFYSAIFAEKETGHPKPLRPDFLGVRLPDRYVFGFGMDVRGAWRNLPEIYALSQADAG
jgi:hypoxanthine phosphoribosyltransferase